MSTLFHFTVINLGDNALICQCWEHLSFPHKEFLLLKIHSVPTETERGAHLMLTAGLALPTALCSPLLNAGNAKHFSPFQHLLWRLGKTCVLQTLIMGWTMLLSPFLPILSKGIENPLTLGVCAAPSSCLRARPPKHHRHITNHNSWALTSSLDTDLLNESSE